MSGKGARAERRDDLFDLFQANPAGLTVDDMRAGLGCSYVLTRQALRDLRLFLGEFNDTNLPCTPQGQGERWLYQLVLGDNAAVREWTVNRLADMFRRLETVLAMAETAVTATDGRSVEGKKARYTELHVRRLLEDVDTII